MIGNERLAACVAEAYAKPRTMSRLTALDDEVILGAYRRGASQQTLAAVYDVSQPAISRAIARAINRVGPAGGVSRAGAGGNATRAPGGPQNGTQGKTGEAA